MPAPNLIGTGIFMRLQASCYTLFWQTCMTVHTVYCCIRPGCRVAIVTSNRRTGIRALGKDRCPKRNLRCVVVGPTFVAGDAIPDGRQEVTAVIGITQVVAELRFRLEYSQVGEDDILNTVEVFRRRSRDARNLITCNDAIAVAVTVVTG